MSSAQAFLCEYFAERQFPRTGRWNYIHYTELEGMDELYDLRADPYELNNLIQARKAHTPLRELKAELARQRDSTRS